MITPTDKLKSNLAAQLAAIAELERLVTTEQSALRARDWSKVESLANEKQGPVTRLQNLYRDLLVQAGRHAIGDIVGANGVWQSWTDLLDAAARLQRANRESMALLEAHKGKAESALGLLRPSADARLYGRNGRTGLSAGTQRLASA